MHEEHPKGFENLFRQAGADGFLLVGFKNPKLKPLTGKRLSEVAKERGTSPEDTIIDLVTRTQPGAGGLFLMSETERRQGNRPAWMSFGSDAAGMAPRASSAVVDPSRAYGNFVRVLGNYARDEEDPDPAGRRAEISAQRRTTSACTTGAWLKAGYFADVVVFDPKTVTDHAP